MKIILIAFIVFSAPVLVFADPPPGVNIVIDQCTTSNCISLLDSAKSVAGFLMIAGSVLAGITIIGAGLMYLMAGGNSTKMTGAKNMLMGGLIGALIIFSPGVIINMVTGFGSNPLGFFGGGGGTVTSTGVPTPTSTSVASVPTYGCSTGNACVLVAGGIYADTTCAGQCGGTGSQSTGSACFDCTNQGQVWCLATASCIASELGCPGVFTKISGGCP